MTNAPIPWSEPLAVTARRHHLRTAIAEKVVAAHVLVEMRKNRADRAKLASSTMATHALDEEVAT